jgi:hypothetical protein
MHIRPSWFILGQIVTESNNGIRRTSVGGCHFCDCRDRCKIALYLGQMLFFYLALNPDCEVVVNLLFLILLIVTKSCVLYLLMHILSSTIVCAAM